MTGVVVFRNGRREVYSGDIVALCAAAHPKRATCRLPAVDYRQL